MWFWVMETSLEIVLNKLYPLRGAATRVGLSEYQFRDVAVRQRKIAFLRHTDRGKLFFRGKDLEEYLQNIRTPALGERGRRAAREAVAAK